MDPQASNVAIAEKIGVNSETVRRARRVLQDATQEKDDEDQPLAGKKLAALMSVPTFSVDDFEEEDSVTADEYDAAQDRGQIQKAGGDRVSKIPKQNNASKVTDVGLSSKEIHEVRADPRRGKARSGHRSPHCRLAMNCVMKTILRCERSHAATRFPGPDSNLEVTGDVFRFEGPAHRLPQSALHHVAGGA